MPSVVTGGALYPPESLTPLIKEREAGSGKPDCGAIAESTVQNHVLFLFFLLLLFLPKLPSPANRPPGFKPDASITMTLQHQV